MVKHPRKKQRLAGLQDAPLGTRPARTNPEKDEEERRLESLVFDGTFTSTKKLLEAAGLDAVNGLRVEEEEEAGDMEHLLDSEVSASICILANRIADFLRESFSLSITMYKAEKMKSRKKMRTNLDD